MLTVVLQALPLRAFCPKKSFRHVVAGAYLVSKLQEHCLLTVVLQALPLRAFCPKKSFRHVVAGALTFVRKMIF